MRILVVEDEPKVAKALQEGLEAENYEVALAQTGEDGFFLASSQAFDLIVLDWMLPGRDGLEVLSTLRKRGMQTPVLVLTAKDAIEERVSGLDAGADDYLVKPFAFSELVARVRSLLRRSETQQDEQLRIEDLELDTHRNRATRGGQQLHLTAKEFLLLAHLVRSAGEVVTRNDIESHVWGIDFQTGTNVLDVMVRRLRAKVDDPFDKKLIHTVRGAGYVLKTT